MGLFIDANTRDFLIFTSAIAYRLPPDKRAVSSEPDQSLWLAFLGIVPPDKFYWTGGSLSLIHI